MTSRSSTQEPAFDLAALYADYAPLVLRRVRRFVGAQEAEEVVHEIFLKVIEKRGTFRAESSPVTWLYTLTTRHCLNRIRDNARRRELLAKHGSDLPLPTRAGSDAEITLFLRELWRAMDPELAVVGIYYFVDGLSHAEIGRALGCSARTVGNRINDLREIARQASA